MYSGLRERKKVATRRALIEAALRLAAERGPDRVTVEDIAEAADVSVRTFFNYFASKDDAVIGVDPDRVQEAVERLLARPAGEPPLEAMRAVLTSTLDRYTDESEGWAVRTELLRAWPHLRARHVAHLETVERRLIEAMAARTGADPDLDVYPTLVVTVAVSALRAALRVWHAPGSTARLPRLVAESFDRLAAGLPPPARKRRPLRPVGAR